MLIGNGIHRYAGNNAWDALLIKLARGRGLKMDTLPKGATATEFFDVLELAAQGRTGELSAEFCALMDDWQPVAHHHAIIGWAQRRAVPVLTTNFDDVLSRAAGSLQLFRPKGRPVIDYYPWESRFAHELFEDPCAGFGIWHVNGMKKYPRSVRLSLSHYMGSAQRVRQWFHSGDQPLFTAERRDGWAGRLGWVHILFNRPLLIFGLALREDEVFLRWLLIQRARYFAKFPDRRQEAWFVFTPEAEDPGEAGRHFFLENLNIRCLPASYDEIYSCPAWLN